MSQQTEQEKPAQSELLEEKFFFVRHGQTDANLAELAAGAGWDIELNATGLAQARALAESVAIEHFRSVKTICVSPMIRARQTAEIINEVINAPVVEIEELREWHLGEWERRSWHELDFRVGNPPGGESNEEFASRVIKGLTTALTHPGPVLIVAHGGVWHRIARHLELPYGEIENCALKHLKRPHKDEVWSLG
ncbi:MAG: histidine phosphatase family protein [Cyanobacteria bacterium DS2.3.42]|nr:histidine phosphatase family protein [Cyanobacteria bacterium DS2.3.42]